jgi:opacity protein-like surface antigen
MIRFAGILIVLFVNIQCYAQRFKREELFVKRGMFGVMGGVAIPVMDFADDNFKLASGYATTGYNIKLGIAYDLSPDFGMALQYQFTNNPFNGKEFFNDIKQANNNNNIAFNSLSSKPWTLQGMMLGVYYPFRTYRTTIDMKLMGGFLTGNLPEYTISYTDKAQNTTYTQRQNETSATNFGFQAGVGIRYQLYKNLLLLGAADFTYTEIEYTDITVDLYPPGITLGAENYTQYYHIINISVGLGIQFE